MTRGFELNSVDVVSHLRAKDLLDEHSSQPLPPPRKNRRLVTDTRNLTKGDVFLAYEGVAGDGHRFLPQAKNQGASYVIVENSEALPRGWDVPWLSVTSGRAAWSHLAAAAYGNPQDNLTFVGVTGTNGKTSTVWMVSGILTAAGVPHLTLGTLGARLKDEWLPLEHTTPDPDRFFPLLERAQGEGIRYVIMEVSSHSVVQEKLSPVTFDAGAFTSFSRDHLDFHPTMEAYWKAKWRFFTDGVKKDGVRVVSDQLAGSLDLSPFSGPTWVYGETARESAFSWGAKEFLELRFQELSAGRTRVRLSTREKTNEVELPFLGRHGGLNFAAAWLLAQSLELAPAAVKKAAPDLQPVPGRLEPVQSFPEGPRVVVDYAHTPQALEQTLGVLRPLSDGHLWVVFGCGGDRDPGKRPLMAQVAEAGADRVVLTSDNPRTEDPGAILQDMVKGLTRPGSVRTIADRSQAIRDTINGAASGDVILIAGKGHETEQVLADRKIPFDDRAEAARWLAERHAQQRGSP